MPAWPAVSTNKTSHPHIYGPYKNRQLVCRLRLCLAASSDEPLYLGGQDPTMTNTSSLSRKESSARIRETRSARTLDELRAGVEPFGCESLAVSDISEHEPRGERAFIVRNATSGATLLYVYTETTSGWYLKDSYPV